MKKICPDTKVYKVIDSEEVHVATIVAMTRTPDLSADYFDLLKIKKVGSAKDFEQFILDFKKSYAGIKTVKWGHEEIIFDNARVSHHGSHVGEFKNIMSVSVEGYTCRSDELFKKEKVQKKDDPTIKELHPQLVDYHINLGILLASEYAEEEKELSCDELRHETPDIFDFLESKGEFTIARDHEGNSILRKDGSDLQIIVRKIVGRGCA